MKIYLKNEALKKNFYYFLLKTFDDIIYMIYLQIYKQLLKLKKNIGWRDLYNKYIINTKNREIIKNYKV